MRINLQFLPLPSPTLISPLFQTAFCGSYTLCGIALFDAAASFWAPELADAKKRTERPEFAALHAGLLQARDILSHLSKRKDSIAEPAGALMSRITELFKN